MYDAKLLRFDGAILSQSQCLCVSVRQLSARNEEEPRCGHSRQDCPGESPPVQCPQCK